MEIILNFTRNARICQLFWWHIERLMTRQGLILWGKSSGDAPTPPSPEETRTQQNIANIQQAQTDTNFNRWAETTPFGAVGWDRGFDQQQYDADIAKRNADIASITQNKDAEWQAKYAKQSKKFRKKVSYDEFKNRRVAEIEKNDPDRISKQPDRGWDRYNTFTRKTELAPELKSLFDNQVKGQNEAMSQGLSALDRQKGVLSQPMLNFGAQSLPGLSDKINAPEIMDKLSIPTADLASRQRVEEALMGRLNPYLDRDRQSMQAQLANQGLVPGTEAYTRAMDDLNRQSNDARLAVIGQGGDEMARQFGMQMQGFQGGLQQNNDIYNQGLANANFGLSQNNQMYNQQANNFNLGQQQNNQLFNQDMMRRNQSLGETQGLFGLSGNVPMPQSNSGQVNTNANFSAQDAANSNYQGQLGAYNSKVAQNNATTQSAVGAGTAVATTGATIGAMVIL